LDELLSNAAVFVLPSDLEGLSLALLEAMAAGVCVLTSDIPENQEVVAGAGFTFKHGDQSDLTRLLDLLIRNPELRRQMGAKGEHRSRSNTFGPTSPVPSKRPTTRFWIGITPRICRLRTRSGALPWRSCRLVSPANAGHDFAPRFD